VLEIAEAGEMQVAPCAETLHRVVAAVAAQVLEFRPPLKQGRAPGTFAAADVEHGPDRPLQVGVGAGDGERDLPGKSRAAADRGGAQGRVAVPAVEVGLVVLFAHGGGEWRGACDPIAPRLPDPPWPTSGPRPSTSCS